MKPTATRRYWKNRHTGMPHVSKGIRTLDPADWQEISQAEFHSLSAELAQCELAAKKKFSNPLDKLGKL
jgi:hypothetical protein